MQTPNYHNSYYRRREDIILPPTPIYRGSYYRRLSAEDLPQVVDSLNAGTDPVPLTQGRLATALRWTAYGLRHGCRHVGVYRLHAR